LTPTLLSLVVKKIDYYTVRVGCQSTRHMVNSSPGRLVSRSTRHRSTRHRVDSSRSRLVTKRQSTRHKQTKHQSRTAAAV